MGRVIVGRVIVGRVNGNRLGDIMTTVLKRVREIVPNRN